MPLQIKFKTLVDDLKEKVEFLDLIGVQAPSDLENQAAKAVEEFLTRLTITSTVSRTEATALMKVLLHSKFNMDARSKIITMVNGRVCNIITI